MRAAPARWGLAARGAVVELGTPEFDCDLNDKDELWSDDLPRIYAKALAAQWDPNTTIDWDDDFELPGQACPEPGMGVMLMVGTLSIVSRRRSIQTSAVH